jgi:hypothetical protein
LVKNPDGSYTLTLNDCVSSGCWQFFDPEVVIGYDVEVMPDSDGTIPYSVASIQVPTVVGDGLYDLYLCYTGETYCTYDTGVQIQGNGGDTSADIFNVADYLQNLQADDPTVYGELAVDPDGGIDDFALRGIDPSADLDPNSPQNFVIGLLFTPNDQPEPDANIKITPEVTDPPAPVPEPASLALFAGALLLGWRARRRG